MYESIPETIILVGEVALEEEHLQPISFEIDKLNELQVLNRKFCETLLETINSNCSPLTVEDYQKSDRYLKRSFPDEKEYQGRYIDVIKYALNVAISNRIDKINMNEIYEILNY